MNKILTFLLLLLLSYNCGKKGELSLSNDKDSKPIEIDEERVYKF